MDNDYKSLLKAVLISNSPELIISALFGLASNDGWVAFFGCLAAIYGVYLIIWIRNSALSYVVQFFTKENQTSKLASEFKSYNLPKPAEYIDEPSDYFLPLIDDEALDIKSRIYASFIMGMCQYPASQFKFIETFRIKRNLRRALQKYSGPYTISQEPESENTNDDDVSKEANIVFKIKAKCLFAANSARKMHESENSHFKDDYNSLLAECFFLLGDIKDEFYQSSALHLISELLVTAIDYSQAQEIIDQIDVDFIKEKAQFNLDTAMKKKAA